MKAERSRAAALEALLEEERASHQVGFFGFEGVWNIHWIGYCQVTRWVFLSVWPSEMFFGLVWLGTGTGRPHVGMLAIGIFSEVVY